MTSQHSEGNAYDEWEISWFHHLSTNHCICTTRSAPRAVINEKQYVIQSTPLALAALCSAPALRLLMYTHTLHLCHHVLPPLVLVHIHFHITHFFLKKMCRISWFHTLPVISNWYSLPNFKILKKIDYYYIVFLNCLTFFLQSGISWFVFVGNYWSRIK